MMSYSVYPWGHSFSKCNSGCKITPGLWLKVLKSASDRLCRQESPCRDYGAKTTSDDSRVRLLTRCLGKLTSEAYVDPSQLLLGSSQLGTWSHIPWLSVPSLDSVDYALSSDRRFLRFCGSGPWTQGLSKESKVELYLQTTEWLILMLNIWQ